MGDEVSSTAFDRNQRRAFRHKVQLDLDVFERMLEKSSFAPDAARSGLEIELNLIDANFDPHFHNAEVLRAIADPGYQTELAQYNIELNVEPRALAGHDAVRLEEELRDSLNAADTKAREVGSRLVVIGILPTIRPEHYVGEWISDNNRYIALNDSIFVARGEDIHLNIEGPTGESIVLDADTIGPESACTSVQLHLQVHPSNFADYWNAAQALSAVQVGLAANSPFFFGKRLLAETRIELFQQATDTRPVEMKNQGVRPRVFFGDRWITSIFDLFEENSRYFPTLLADVSDEDPEALLAQGVTPKLSELRLHNGTIYRWNRPVYDVVDNIPHVRIENRVLPAGPTIADVMANAAFYYGTIRTLATQDRPVWTKLSFATCRENFDEAAMHGIEARVYWPGYGEVGIDELVLRHLLPMAHEGLEEWGVAPEVRERYLGIIEGRCLSGVNGASWQVDTVERLEGEGMSRDEALHEMLRRYVAHMDHNAPVHTWQ